MDERKIYPKYIKRVLDIILSVTILMILIPLFIIISVAIVCGSGWPIIYRQVRSGQYGKNFVIYKFRTMVNGADRSGTSTKAGDSRITAVGRLLRKTSLDELPQLVNVIKGNMSLVGFRPDVPRENDDFSRDKWNVKPGITGYAQVNGRSELSLEMAHYFEDKYTKEISLLLDCKIILKTVQVVIARKGAN